MTTAITTAEILAVGSELLSLHRIDTNSLVLTGRLAELGITVRAKAIVGDHRGDLSTLLAAALVRAPLVITTGGLGPTDDDLTRDVAADLLGRPQREDPAILAMITARFTRRGLRMPDINRRQARVPEGAVVLDNPNGSAPGLLFQLPEDRLLVLLPGPPREMRPMFEDHVVPRLARLSTGRRVRRRVLKITGRSESQVEEIAYPIYSTLGAAGAEVETTILASPGQIELHVAATGADVSSLDTLLEAGVERLSAALAPYVFSVDGRTLEEVVGEHLQSMGWRMAAAESCTGGLLLGRLTDVPGSSAWVVGGVVAYDNAVKTLELDVPSDLLAAHGAVSEPVALAMATGARQRLGADIAVAITGIAGPSGGSAEKPVGTVVIAVSAGDDTRAHTFHFPGDREMVRRFSTSAALDLVRMRCSDQLHGQGHGVAAAEAQRRDASA
jgi:nicotinamide-nucleotide amidase